jgi:aryl-alcohol dehydrogenase-like predicted oxidoreductase
MQDEMDHIEDGFTRRMMEIYGTDENFERLRRAQELGERKGGCSAVEVALAWMLSRPFQVVPIIGPRTKPELESCLRALSIELTASEIQWLNLGM